MSPNEGDGGGGGVGSFGGLSQGVQLCTWSPNKLWRSKKNSIVNLWLALTNNDSEERRTLRLCTPCWNVKWTILFVSLTAFFNDTIEKRYRWWLNFLFPTSYFILQFYAAHSTSYIYVGFIIVVFALCF
jgi:hypothetical protein